MDEEAYDALLALQERHWWHIGARAVCRTLIRISLGQSSRPLRMLEVGCGTGGNLALLGEYGPTVGIDISFSALGKISRRSKLGLVQASATALPFATGSFDGIHLLDVIEHLVDDLVAVREAARVCRPAGAVLINTSALPVLWSHHDDANHHQRRYYRSQLASLIENAGLIPLRLSYQNFFTFIPTLLTRLYQRWVTRPTGYDIGSFPEPINAILAGILRFEAFLIRFMELPIGVDLVAVCRPKK
jgi:ubiquinone/menaquinone biosynthesis C-methylase UbiE